MRVEVMKKVQKKHLLRAAWLHPAWTTESVTANL
jgi:hypothetical protein